MNLKFLKSGKVLAYIGGAATVLCGKQIVKSKTAHDLCVKGVAKGMRLYKDAKAAAVNIKEDAEDIISDAMDTIETEEA